MLRAKDAFALCVSHIFHIFNARVIKSCILNQIPPLQISHLLHILSSCIDEHEGVRRHEFLCISDTPEENVCGFSNHVLQFVLHGAIIRAKRVFFFHEKRRDNVYARVTE